MKLIFKGVVQGVGFRPTIYRVAKQLNLKGYVLNKGSEVEVVVDKNHRGFIETVKKNLPSIAKISDINIKPDNRKFNDFRIIHSKDGKRQSLIPVDIGICNDCLNEIFDKKNRRYFFHKEIIKKSGQKRWYDKYFQLKNDYIFMVLYKGLRIGCIGYREICSIIDIYNVILGRMEYGKKGLMGKALLLLCSYLMDNINDVITAKVLKNNPAIKWYKKNNFIIKEKEEDYLLLQLDINNFRILKYNLTID